MRRERHERAVFNSDGGAINAAEGINTVVAWVKACSPHGRRDGTLRWRSLCDDHAVRMLCLYDRRGPRPMASRRREDLAGGRRNNVGFASFLCVNDTACPRACRFIRRYHNTTWLVAPDEITGPPGRDRHATGCRFSPGAPIRLWVGVFGGCEWRCS